jgi:pyruvate kinase
LAEKKAKIVCTLGPSSIDPSVLFSLIQNGMDVARLNFSHGDHEEHKKAIGLIRKASEKCNKPVAILQDLQGVKIRAGKVKGGSVLLEKGDSVLVMPGDGLCDRTKIYISYSNIVQSARAGDRISLDDGLIQLEVESAERDSLRTIVRESGVLRDRKGVNLPFKITTDSFTLKDEADLGFGLSMGVDYVALSYVQSTSDVERIRSWFQERNVRIPIIAKIEKPEALEIIEDLLDMVDGIMIARGDLGVELPPEEIPVIQKRLIELSNRKGKIVITATQMLESMTEHVRPTRAEATDVANAVIDGTDALMLSAETASGKHPAEAVSMMSRIIQYTEKNSPAQSSLFAFTDAPSAGTAQMRKAASATENSLFSEAVAGAACKAAEDIQAKFIIACTDSGYTAKLVSKFRPKAPILAFTPEPDSLRRMALYWGVHPRLMKPPTGTDEMIREVERSLVEEGLVKKGDRIVITASAPLLGSGKTNLLKLHRIGEDYEFEGSKKENDLICHGLNTN